MQADVAAFLDYRFEKISLMKSDDKKEIWRVKVKATGENAVMKISELVGAPYAELKKISHPLLAKIFYCTNDGTVCVEEYIEGELLSAFVDAENFFDEDAAKDFLLQICDGLSVLHGKNIIHRDIKPSNIIRRADGTFKLIDFDVARIFKAGKNRDTKQLGTDGYAAPEQFGHGQTDARSDIYALGHTLKELLGKNYHGAFEKIISKCTEYDPKLRFQSVDELKAALLDVANAAVAEKNIVDYRAVEGVDAPQKYEVAEKKSYGKIFLICAGIIFTCAAYSFNSTQEEKIPPAEEKFSVEENVDKEITPVEEKISEEKKSEFAEIKMPQFTPATSTNPPPAQNVTPPAQVATPQIQLPPNFKPSFPNQEDVTPSDFKPSFPEPSAAEKFVQAKYFLNGKQINDWQDDSAADSEISHVVHVPFEVWKNNSAPLMGTLAVRVENLSAEIFAPQLEITFEHDGNLQTENLIGTILNSGQAYTFNISLNKFLVETSKDAAIGSAELRIKISGSTRIVGSSATITFLLAQKGFPIPKD